MLSHLIASPADFVAAFLGSARSLPTYRGIPERVAAAGRFKLWPLLRKQPDIVTIWHQLPQENSPRRFPARVAAASPATATTSRQVRRYLTREFDKDRTPLRNNITQVLRARQMAERNEARLAERQPEPSLEHYA